ncbi:outer membrane protein OmpA-like peptidoglycan-associated protein [Rhodopseudomonas thermotolerans]|uniref:Outer membrane protein OmpA-like peptidoglycan-associated protein n=2 Tax=Rhodopseudomonas TaxID=1073 RepID=A0A336JKJ0_9BRAD|nr:MULTISPECIES: OmpA family protein [Rhodopseudomonas]RED37697.1 outer membrane protein OmpA-like peptidoglycan-associated protein [Rhodopseudomonas pentothenatexigens]REG04431.1 outer membrane protein OmpA-like peptidoglycan-associated protein [Rhodopseudomonas thermotolerans]SSW90197.1 outer membrane protein OmpA-like peptidoglycan-associated protein [Rhodopseudomonas pentothenatexigens]
MLYLVTHYWIWLAAAFVVGAVTPLLADKFGWAADLENYWVSRVGVVLAVALVLVAAQLASGKAELMLEAGVGLVIAYFVGGLAGGVAPGLLPVRFEGWWVGLFVTGLILAVFGITTLPKLEPDLRERVAEVVKEAGADPLNFDVAGRDVLLPADLGNDKVRAALGEQIAKVPGVRRVTDVDELSGAALAAKTVAKLQADAEAKAKAEAEAAAQAAAAKEAEAKAMAAMDAAQKRAAKAKADAEAKEAAAKAAAEAAAKEAAAKEAAAKQAAEQAAAEEAAKKAADQAAAKQAAAKAAEEAAAKPAAVKPAAPAAEIKTASATGELPVASTQDCQGRVTAVASAEKISFERRGAVIDKASQPLLDKLAAAIKQCPAVTIEVAGYTDAAGKKSANVALSKRRAEAVVASLTKAGIGPVKLVAAGYGSAKPIAGNDTAEGRAQNRRIEFVVK